MVDLFCLLPIFAVKGVVELFRKCLLCLVLYNKNNNNNSKI